MPITLSPTAYVEKNALSSTGVWVVLCEIFVPQLNDYIRICSNNEDIVFRGAVWQPFPFAMDEIGDSAKGELTQFSIKICNINGMVEGYVDQANGGTGSTVTIMVINTNIPADDPEVSLDFIVKSTSVDNNWVTFVLGSTNPYTISLGQRMIRTGCRFNGADGSKNGFRGSRCKYSGGVESCDKTLTTCRLLGNSHNFGGFPGIGIGNTFYV